MKKTVKDAIEWTEVPALHIERELAPVMLTDETMAARKEKVLALMKSESLDAIAVYGDLEHGSNFEYLTGFLTRFEEGMLVLHQDGTAYLLLGNENLNKAGKSRIPVEGIHVPYFSLPNQPMENDKKLTDYFRAAALKEDMKVGLVGWKMFTSQLADNRQLFDAPYYVVEALKAVVGAENLSNHADLFIGGEKGARTQNNANELAHYEFGAQLASQGLLKATDLLAEGVSEMELGSALNAYGQPPAVVTIAATGERFVKANIYPTDKKVRLQDPISLTIGYKGGLSSCAGYAVNEASELPAGKEDYLDVLAKPYFAAVTTWLENVHVGMKGDDLYQLIEEVLPQADYHWHLNPGHLVADEEWMSSPIYPGSKETLKSGMMLQIDIIPGQPGYAGASCESGVALADEALRAEIKESYPELFDIFQKRREYLKKVLQIDLHEDILPMNDTVAFYRPFLLNKSHALRKKLNS